MITKNDNLLEIPVEALTVWGAGAITNFMEGAKAIGYHNCTIYGKNFSTKLEKVESADENEDDDLLLNIYSDGRHIACLFATESEFLYFKKEDDIVHISEK